MRVLIACEFSGVVRDAFIARGHDAWSCDLEPCELPGPHFQDDIFHVLAKPLWHWDLMIAHPPCTYLCNSGVKWLYHDGRKENGRDPQRWVDLEAAAQCYNALWAANIERVVLENPIMHEHAVALLSPDMPEPQYIQPWQFGHREMKATGLRVRGLPPLKPTNIVGPPPRAPVERRKWARVHQESPGPDRWKNRSRTLPGIADAFAAQYGNVPMTAAA